MTRPIQVIHISLKKRLLAVVLGAIAIALRGWRSLFRAPVRERAVLLIEPFGFGDVISHEPLVRLLRDHRYEVTFCGAAPWRVLLPEVAWVDSEVAWGRHSSREKYLLNAYTGSKFRAFLRTLRRAAAGGVGIDTRGDIRSVMLLHLAGCRKVISLSCYLGSDLNMPRLAALTVEACPDLRRWESNLRCAAPLGLAPKVTSSPRLTHLMQPAPASAARRLALVPVAPWRGKWWPIENWRALVPDLEQRGFECVVLCGPGQREAADDILQGRLPVIQIDTETEWAERLQEFSFFVTLDSGPMHLADALGRPVVALFGQGSLPLWAPSHPDSVVVTHQGDPDFRLLAPTDAHTASGEEFMRRITVEEVLQAVDKVAAKQRVQP